MKIRMYGKIGDMIGREVELDLPPGGCTIAELRGLLARRFPQAERELTKPTLRACVDETLVGEDFAIGPEARVEFFPPLSGG